jgi:hypothetical protein
LERGGGQRARDAYETGKEKSPYLTSKYSFENYF